MIAAPPDISLPRFEGPLDLLLELVRKHQVDITDIPISEITRQYLDYLHQAARLDIDLGAEFSYIAALLIHIKSKSLLASDPELAAEEDPRQELTRLLLDHDQVRQGAEFLKQKLELTQATWSKTPSEEFPPEPASVPAVNGTMNLLEILRLAKQSLETARAYEIIFPAESVTVEEMVGWIEGRIAGEFESSSLAVFFQEQATADRRMALFLAALEMVKEGRLELKQDECFGAILVTKGTNMP